MASAGRKQPLVTSTGSGQAGKGRYPPAHPFIQVHLQSIFTAVQEKVLKVVPDVETFRIDRRESRLGQCSGYHVQSRHLFDGLKHGVREVFVQPVGLHLYRGGGKNDEPAPVQHPLGFLEDGQQFGEVVDRQGAHAPGEYSSRERQRHGVANAPLDLGQFSTSFSKHLGGKLDAGPTSPVLGQSRRVVPGAAGDVQVVAGSILRQVAAKTFGDDWIGASCPVLSDPDSVVQL